MAHLMKKIGFNPSITYPVEIRSTPPMSDSTFVWCAFPVNIQTTLSHASAKTESENNRRAAQGTVTELHPAAH